MSRRTSNAPRLASIPSPAPFRPAEVVGGRGAELELALDGGVVGARLAIAERPRVGDEVLVADGGDGARYVIGVLRRLREVEVLAQTSDGTRVRLSDEGGETLTVEAADGTVLFEHRDGKSRVVAPRGALELRAEAGDLMLSAAKRVRIEGAEGVEVRSARSVQLEVEGGAHLSLARRGVQLVVEELRAKLGRAVTEVEGDAKLSADTLELASDVVRTVARRVSVEATQLVERLGESYRDVEGLAQTRAGRVRMVAEETFRILGERTLFKARQDMKLKGETIYLD
ncbi:MAG: DUF3540 domain-containing protein [Sandaracinaceae bacterium]|nr:DUF3540 domain-containing protein [Sandaracinaceae bacterium]